MTFGKARPSTNARQAADGGMTMTEQPGPGWTSPAWGEPGIPPASTPTAASPGEPPAGPWGAYGWGVPPPPVAAQPGVVPLRPLGVGEILDGAITTIRRHPRVTIGVAALVVGAEQLITVATRLASGSLPGLGPSASASATGFGGLTPLGGPGGVAVLIGNFLLSTVLGALLAGLLIAVVGEAVLGRPVVLGVVWGRVRPRVRALVAGSILAGLLPLLGVGLVVLAALLLGATGTALGRSAGTVVALLVGLPALIAGAYLWGILALTTPAMMLEKLSPLQGLRRSRQLVKPDFWRVFGIRVLGTVIAQILTGVIAVPFGAAGLILAALAGSGAGDGRFVIALVAIALGATLAGAIVQPFLAGVVGLLYIDRRMRGEGLDIVLAEASRPAGPTR